MLDEPRPAGRGPYTKPHTREWSRIVSAGSAYVFVVPEYNHGYNAATKNALDFLNEEWRDKPVGFVGYGGSAGGARAVQALLPVVIALGLRPAARSVHIPLINRAVGPDGVLRTDDRLADGALRLLDELYQSKGARDDVVLAPGL
jgi:NAD(P)H-dependent FMN reductase